MRFGSCVQCRVYCPGRDAYASPATISGVGAREIVRAGLAHVVEGHRVFTRHSVFDNLMLAAYDLSRRERITRVEEALTLFRKIAAKRSERAAWLSGGQQQILAVAQG
jgi:branched-chain amino acid transport system ATP-binding protein